MDFLLYLCYYIKPYLSALVDGNLRDVLSCSAPPAGCLHQSSSRPLKGRPQPGRKHPPDGEWQTEALRIRPGAVGGRRALR